MIAFCWASSFGVGAGVGSAGSAWTVGAVCKDSNSLKSARSILPLLIIGKISYFSRIYSFKAQKQYNMKKQLFALAALAMVLVGCKKEIDGPEPIPESEFLVVKAECIPLGKTSYNDGETAWVKGDLIELLYKGDLYTYTAETSGNSVYFSSENGIADYDGSEIVAYYNAFIAEENLVGIEATKTVTYEGDEFISPANTPMVGCPIEAKSEKGIVTIGFKNIFFHNITKHILI